MGRIGKTSRKTMELSMFKFCMIICCAYICSKKGPVPDVEG